MRYFLFVLWKLSLGEVDDAHEMVQEILPLDHVKVAGFYQGL